MKIGDLVELVSVKEFEERHHEYITRNGVNFYKPNLKVGDVGTIVKDAVFGDGLYEVLFPTCNLLVNEAMVRVLPPEITLESVTAAMESLPPRLDPQVELWRRRILAAWEKYGISGQPLDQRTVEHLAIEFAKPYPTHPPLSFQQRV